MYDSISKIKFVNFYLPGINFEPLCDNYLDEFQCKQKYYDVWAYAYDFDKSGRDTCDNRQMDVCV